MNFREKVRLLLEGSNYTFEEDIDMRAVRIVCGQTFRNDLSKLAWYNLPMGITLVVNGEVVPYALENMSTERVNHPAHYGGEDNPFEVIKVMEAWLTQEEFIGAMKFQIFKYTARARHKNNSEDHAKSAWYDNYLCDYMKRKDIA